MSSEISQNLTQLDRHLLRNVYNGQLDEVDHDQLKRLQMLGLLEILGENRFQLSSKGARVIEDMPN